MWHVADMHEAQLDTSDYVKPDSSDKVSLPPKHRELPVPIVHPSDDCLGMVLIDDRTRGRIQTICVSKCPKHRTPITMLNTMQRWLTDAGRDWEEKFPESNEYYRRDYTMNMFPFNKPDTLFNVPVLYHRII